MITQQQIELTNKLLDNKARQSNIIDLNAYSQGITDAFDALKNISPPQ